jgi:predicted acetyltransferase
VCVCVCARVCVCVNSVDPELESDWFQPLNPESEKLVSKFGFSHSTLYRYAEGSVVRAIRRMEEVGLYKFILIPLTHSLKGMVSNLETIK